MAIQTSRAAGSLWICFIFLLPAGGASLAAEADASEELNSLLCDPARWSYNKRYVSIRAQREHVHGDGQGLLFAYTRDSASLLKPDGKFNNAAYRPSATVKLPSLDLSAYNRLSFWIYVEGNAEEAFQWGFKAAMPFRMSCRSGEWFHAKWDIAEEPGVDLKAVSQLTIRGINQGSAPGDPAEARIYLSDFRLEKATPDYHEGWTPHEDVVVLPYTGILPGERISALLAPVHAGKPFRLTGDGVALTGKVSDVRKTRCADFAAIDIVAPDAEGIYTLTVEGGPSGRFVVSRHPYDEAISRALRLVRAQRCGCASELHGPCHLDDAIREDIGERVDVSGGWHDEGVAQFFHLTIQTTRALARLRRAHSRPYRLGLNEGAPDDLVAEVEWGVRSIMKYELGGGLYLHSFVPPHWRHTDNRPGTRDDRRINVRYPHQLYLWWFTEALAAGASVCKEPLRSRAREAAERAWALHESVGELYPPEDRKRWKRDERSLRPVAAHVAASLEMYRLTGVRKYAVDAARTAAHLLEFQERENPGGGLVGFFYSTLDAGTPYVGVNGKSLELPARPLAELLMTFPNHPDAPKWRKALRLYAEGTLKPLARVNSPYGCIAAGPYLEPLTDSFEEVRMGGQFIYPLPVTVRKKRRGETLRSHATLTQISQAGMTAAIGLALKDRELVRMAEEALRFVLGANPYRFSMMRGLGERCPIQAQLPNVPGMLMGWLGITDRGLPFFNPRGACRLEAPPRFIVKEGNTALAAYLMEACAYLE